MGWTGEEGVAEMGRGVAGDGEGCGRRWGSVCQMRGLP